MKRSSYSCTTEIGFNLRHGFSKLVFIFFFLLITVLSVKYRSESQADADTWCNAITSVIQRAAAGHAGYTSILELEENEPSYEKLPISTDTKLGDIDAAMIIHEGIKCQDIDIEALAFHFMQLSSEGHVFFHRIMSWLLL